MAAFLSRPRDQSPSKRPHDVAAEEEGCEDYWVNVSAKAGELWLRIGLASMIDDEMEYGKEMEVLRKEGVNISKKCEGLGGTLQAVGAVLTACLSKEFLVTKYASRLNFSWSTDRLCRTQLRSALNLSTAAQDNHLRALVLALAAAQYVHTSTEHAETMLDTAEQLATGLGATPVHSKGKQIAGKNISVGSEGNAHLRLWIGERSLGLSNLLDFFIYGILIDSELKRRAGDEESVSKQTEINKNLIHATENLKKRKISQIS